MKQKNSDQDLVTKGFLKIELNELMQKIDEKAKKYRDEILTKMDGVMGELQTMREENTIGTYQSREVRDQVEDHERRIKRLEKPQQ